MPNDISKPKSTLQISRKRQHINNSPSKSSAQSHMFTTQSSKTRKRQTRDWDSALTPDSADNNRKRQKHAGRIRPPSPSVFWRNLSEIHLTKAALRELDRRNSTILTKSQPTFLHSSTREQTRRCSADIAGSLKRFARQGGPDMSEARGHRGPGARKSGQPSHQARQQVSIPVPSDDPTTKTTSTRSSGPYNRNFDQHLTDNGIFPDEYDFPDGRVPQLPSNYTEIVERLRKPPDSLPSLITTEDFKKFKKANANAFKEMQVTAAVIPLIAGQVKDARCTAGNVPFGNLDPLTDGTLKPGHPDIYYGARPEQLDRKVREELEGLVIPSTQDNLPICPNFFVAIKGPDGSRAVASRQALYHGALGARGIYSLQNYGQAQSTFINQAFTITSVYHGGILDMYSIYRAEPTVPDGRPEYYMHQLRSISMKDSVEMFQQGITAYRAAVVWAEEQRNQAIDRANRAVSTVASEIDDPNTPTTSTWLESETFGPPVADESSDLENSQNLRPPANRSTSGTTLENPSTTSRGEIVSDLNTSKRAREQMQGDSPVQQKRRTRVEDERDS